MRILKRLLLVVLVGSWPAAMAQPSTVNYRVYLLGNTADIGLESDFYSHLASNLSESDPFTVVLNGDLIDSRNNKKPTSLDSLKIRKLLQAITKHKNGNVVIVPGDRDWASSGKKGWKSAVELEKMIKSMKFKNVSWAIDKGCPGPKLIEINDQLILILINTQWWNHPYSKPDPTSAECKISTERDFLIELENLVEDTEGKNILVAGHFPLKSLGKYGGNFPLSNHLIPPIYGSAHVGYRQNIGTRKDIVNGRFDGIRGRIENIILRKGAVIYAAGHERNLQVLEMGENFIMNSGSPVYAEFVAKSKMANEYTGAIPGMVELVYYQSGRIDYRIHHYQINNQFIVNKEHTLFHSPCDAAVGNENFNSAVDPCDPPASNARLADSWPSHAFLAGGDYEVRGLNKFLLGQHYRTSWMVPVKAPYLDLQNTFGGLKVYEKGGGHQTTSLKIKGGNGREYVFRSVDKDPVQLLPYELQGTVIARIMQDITSMQQPYGAMAVGSMLNATDILHAEPKLYIMPPSNNLGPFKTKYSNLLGMLEEKPINVKNTRIPFANADEILQSRKMFRELYRDHDNMVDAKEYARARMFDILIGDWGKHEDNWKWAGYKKEHGMMYRPIPRDRDYVFSRWDGLLPYLADRKWGIERGENFGYKLNDIRSLTFSSQPADRRLLNELSREDWQEAAQYIQTSVTSEVIEQGIKSMPEEVYELSGKEIENKLKQRSKDLGRYADEYYKQLMIGGVEVVGSNKREFFEVVRNADGSVRVKMYNIKNDEKGNRLYFDRKFSRKETKEIRLYGLGGEDVFSITGEARKSIRTRIIGGQNADIITDHSVVKSGGKKTLIYEKSEKAKLDLGGEAKMIHHWDKSLYDYDRQRFGFNRYFPIAAFTYNTDQGFGIVAGVEFTRKRYGKQNYSAKHSIVGTFTTEDINIIEYNGRFHHVLGKWDVQLNGLAADHNNFNLFYGLGNNTIKDENLAAADFYQTQYNTYGLGTGLVRDFWKKSSIAFEVNYEINKTLRTDNTIIGENNPSIPAGVFGLDEADMVELTTELNLDFRDRPNLPEKGTRFFLKQQSGTVTSNNDARYGIIQGSFEQYASTRSKNPITLGVKVGGSTSYGEETIPFYKLKYLGQNNNLRGFAKNRFTGKSSAYINTELRVQLSEFRTSFVPMKFGIKGFFDMGRVYSDFDISNIWHQGYGAGVYLVPLSESFAISISGAYSDEESGLILLSIGSTFK